MQVPPPATETAAPAPRWRWNRPAVVTVTALTGINLFNYVDRYVLSALNTKLELPVEQGGLGLSKEHQGDLYSAFIVVYALTSPAFGLLGDRYRRMWIIAGAVALWSVATSSGGLMHSLLTLLIARACTGIGEAAYASITPSVISDVVPASARGRALAYFNAAIPVGAALGFILGGAVADAYGWREAFLVAGVPGLALAVWALFIREPVRGAMDPGPPPTRPRLADAARALWRRAYALPVLGYILQTAGFGALGFWAPSYLEQAKGIEPARATITFGIVVVATGLSGTVLGGILGDRWLRRNPRALMWVCGLSSLAAVPCVALVVAVRDPALVWTFVALGSFLLVMSVGPVNAEIVNALAPNVRATGVAVCTTLIHLLGDVPSVPLIGALTDRLTAAHGVAGAWERSFLVVPACILGGGLAWCAAALWGGASARDAATAAARGPGAEPRRAPGEGPA
jgi:MFS family permease